MRAALVGLLLATPAAAQDAETLADVRQALGALYLDIQDLRAELSTSGTGGQGTATAGSALDRLAGMEAELTRLVSKTEELEFRIDRVTRDGTTRVGDLEFRLCELEADCDVMALGDTPTLGGVDAGAGIPVPAPAPVPGPSLAVGEQAEFDAAMEAFRTGEFEQAIAGFARLNETYPGGPLAPRADYLRGEALEALGDPAGAARAYLAAFSAAPEGAGAADALYKLGASLAALDQVQDGCATLAEVLARFPTSNAAADADEARAQLGCG
ncbi:MAG: tol-pal system protein YbgF [Paracoccaceae bacterium]